MDPDRWESGSDFHWPPWSARARATGVPWAGGIHVSTGRDALRLVLASGTSERGWRRLWVPEYFCQHVTAALVRPDLELRPYPDNPLLEAPSLPDSVRGDAVLVMNYFGLRGPLEAPRRDGVEIVEDHSHDPLSPWSRTSTADFCVASLRKTIPLPDGGVAWSPRGHPLPAEPAPAAQRTRAASARLAAMILKGKYLSGDPVDKATYRELSLRGERAFHRPARAAMSEVSRATLDSFPFEAWREARASNHAVLRDLLAPLAPLAGIHLLEPYAPKVAPFACVLIAESAARRERIRAALIEARIFPAVHWPLERTVLRIGAESRRLSRRLLAIHCDGRYGADDMRRIAAVVIRSVEEDRAPGSGRP